MDPSGPGWVGNTHYRNHYNVKLLLFPFYFNHYNIKFQAIHHLILFLQQKLEIQ